MRVCSGDHGLPHVHVEFRDGCRCSVAIETLELLVGAVQPKKRLKPILEWIREHESELLKQYRSMNR
ncbi:MAG: DUF4160 domain-containing protein [Gammaproteobacteria bacterium]|nr:DUF4160 domain-containing protein [Gammaproteobacteria bacterium]